MISVLEYLELSAKRLPDKTAVADPEERASFEELLKSAERIGSALAAHVSAGSPVPVYLPKGVKAVRAFMGAVCAGCFYSMLDKKQPEARLSSILDTLDAKVLVTDYENAEKASLYYEFPKKHRWILLLGVSLFYYVSAGPLFLLYLLFAAVTTWVGGRYASRGINALLSYMLIPYQFTRMKIHTIETEDFDDLILGSSHGSAAIDPAVLSEKTGRTCFSAAAGGPACLPNGFTPIPYTAAGDRSIPELSFLEGMEGYIRDNREYFEKTIRCVQKYKYLSEKYNEY